MSLTKEFLESKEPIDSLEGMRFNSYEYEAIRARFTNKLLIERTLYALKNCSRPRYPALTYEDELQALAALLAERLQEMLSREEAARRAHLMESLTGMWGLALEEAERVYEGGKLEFEEGECRKCKGKGRLEVFGREGCFGQESWMEDCRTCNGKGKDSHRLKVPEKKAVEEKPDEEKLDLEFF